MAATPAVAGAALALLAFLFRDVLAHGLGRITVPLYTKLRKEKLLNVAARDTLYRIVQASPGIHFLALQKEFGASAAGPPIAYGALAYHLSQLERFQLIVSKREGRYRRYFDQAGRIGADAARIALLQSQPVPLLARRILDQPGVTVSELHDALQAAHPISRQAVAYHLRRMAAKELVVREDRGRFAHFRPTERLEKLRAFVFDAMTGPAGEVASAPAVAT